MLALSIVFNIVLFVARADFWNLFCSLQLLYWTAEESALLAHISLMIPVIAKRHKCFDDWMRADDPKRAANHVVRCSFWVVSPHPTKHYAHANRCIGFSTINEILRDDDPDRPPFVTIGHR